MAVIIFFFLLVAVVCSGGIFYIINYNKLMDYHSKLEHSEALIDDNLRDKYDFLGEINVQLSSVLDNKKSYLKGFDTLRDERITNFDFDRKLVEYVGVINQLNEDFIEVSQDKEIKKLLKNIKEIDERLNATKQYYNRYTALNNRIVRIFPTNIISNIHKVDVRPFYDGKDMTDDIVDDFKI